MKKLIIPASAALVVNLLAGLLLTAYAPMTLLFTSMVIVINTLLTGLLYALGAESTHRMSLGMVFLGLGTLEFVSGFFAPERWTDNWWLMVLIALTAMQGVAVWLAIYYSKRS